MSVHESIGKSDEHYTPKYVFDALGEEFDLDVASPVNRKYCHVPAKAFYYQKALEKKWNGFVWMNPPFGGRNQLVEWLKAIAVHGNGIALTPDRTSAPWYELASRTCSSKLLVHKKIQFIKPDGTIGRSPANGTTLFAYGLRGMNALRRAELNGLGIVWIRPNRSVKNNWSYEDVTEIYDRVLSDRE